MAVPVARCGISLLLAFVTEPRFILLGHVNAGCWHAAAHLHGLVYDPHLHFIAHTIVA